ncbi:hypothetical protein CBI38_24290 [Rhodococcus oxybenzonivorans]|uniref:AB hydrolase-1 domain-containing protein n=1 Tax=Rhodococcus oxybenzonivorans TaxID=1990687 RepID=A0A2S2C0E3_9NOCA|nr:alpha/beta hydrolase [Rhodococcus oxybenzonivorans]AWK74208.1 hypothetical protein CBI38_24290 [Rhodococcus oxybenzonivorans]
MPPRRYHAALNRNCRTTVFVRCGRRESVLLHGGGPDHHSLLPMANRLADRFTAVVPDVRGYGRSVCRDPALHTWSRYTADVIALLDHLGVPEAVVGGTGLGGTIALRVALAFPARVRTVVVISAEDIEDDDAKLAETGLMDRFADRIEAAWRGVAWRGVAWRGVAWIERYLSS